MGIRIIAYTDASFGLHFAPHQSIFLYNTTQSNLTGAYYIMVVDRGLSVPICIICIEEDHIVDNSLESGLDTLIPYTFFRVYDILL